MRLCLHAPAACRHQLAKQLAHRPDHQRHRQIWGRTRAKQSEDDLLRADMERLERDSSQQPSSRPQPQERLVFSRRAGVKAGEGESGLLSVLNKVLVADFFLILGALAWFIAGVSLKAGAQSTALLDSWYSLWGLVFQPALGVLMLGALTSGAASWLKDKRDPGGR